MFFFHKCISSLTPTRSEILLSHSCSFSFSIQSDFKQHHPKVGAAPPKKNLLLEMELVNFTFVIIVCGSGFHEGFSVYKPPKLGSHGLVIKGLKHVDKKKKKPVFSKVNVTVWMCVFSDMYWLTGKTSEILVLNKLLSIFTRWFICSTYPLSLKTLCCHLKTIKYTWDKISKPVVTFAQLFCIVSIYV